MKKSRILTLVLSIILVAVLAITMFACNDKCTDHVDEDGDNKCDVCGEAVQNSNDENNTPNDGKEDYSFTLKDNEGNGVEGVSVKVNIDGIDGEVKLTDAEGKVVFRVGKKVKFVSVSVIDLPEEYDMPGTKNFIYDVKNGERNKIDYGVTKKAVYSIKVVDQDGIAVEGVQVQICNSVTGVCHPEKRSTNANGIVTYTLSVTANDSFYVSITALPNDYKLKDGEILNETGVIDFTHYDDFNSDNELEIEIVKLNMATITTGGFNYNCADIEVKIYDAETNALVVTVITGANGKATFPLEKKISKKVGGATVYNYYLTARHKDNDPRYTWDEPDEGVLYLTSANMKVDLSYLDKVTYTINVARTNDELSVEGVRVRLYNRLFEEIAVSETDANGTTSFVMIPYDTYYVKLENVGNGATSLYEIKKDGVTTHNLTINDDLVLGSEQAPIDLMCGFFNVLPAVEFNEKIYCRVFHQEGAELVIEGANVVIRDVEDESNQQSGTNINVKIDKASQVFLIEAQEALNYWGASVYLEGTSDRTELIKESELDGPVSVNLEKGKYYYTFEADENDATLLLSSSDDVKFLIEGVETEKAVLSQGDSVIFAVIGEGEVSFNLTYEKVYYDYIVSVGKEYIGIGNDILVNGIEIELKHEGTVIGSAETVNGKATFTNVQEYPTDKIWADIKTLPEKYTRHYENLNGAYFKMGDSLVGENEEDGIVYYYEASFVISLVREGTQELPYKWVQEGHSPATAYEVTIPESGKVYVENEWENRAVDAPDFYYVYVYDATGEITLCYHLFDKETGKYDYTVVEGVNGWLEDKKATWLQVPLNTNIAIEADAPAGGVKLRWATSLNGILNLSSGDAVSTGTKENPFTLVFGQTITTPDFVEGNSDETAVDVYYYSYKASIPMNIEITNLDADILVFVNGNITDITSGSFEVSAGDKISFEIRTAKEAGDENILDGVSFAVKVGSN